MGTGRLREGVLLRGLVFYFFLYLLIQTFYFDTEFCIVGFPTPSLSLLGS